MTPRYLIASLAVLTMLLLSATSAHAAAHEKIVGHEVTINAPDTSVELVGDIYLPDLEKYPKPPLVVLLHQANSSKDIWKDFAEDIASRGFAALAMDLRGYGLSIYNLKLHRNRPQGVFYEGDFDHYPNDIATLVGKALLDWGFRIDTTRFAVIGAELGGSAGILWAQNEPRVKYTAIISPGLDRKGLRIAPVIKNFDDRPLYLVASKQDIYASQSCYLLSDVVDRVLDMDIVDGFLHGNALVNADPDVWAKLIDDLQRYLGDQQAQ